MPIFIVWVQECWFNYDKKFSIFSLKIPKWGILGLNLMIFIFALNFSMRQIEEGWFQVWLTLFFTSSNLRMPKSVLFGPKLKDYYFCIKLWNKTNFWFLISKDNSFYQIPVWSKPIKQKKTPIKRFWS